jgi:hypothetical protein
VDEGCSGKGVRGSVGRESVLNEAYGVLAKEGGEGSVRVEDSGRVWLRG